LFLHLTHQGEKLIKPDTLMYMEKACDTGFEKLLKKKYFYSVGNVNGSIRIPMWGLPVAWWSYSLVHPQSMGLKRVPMPKAYVSTMSTMLRML
jgi:hypothetical protein